jgi:hypothetical protein
MKTKNLIILGIILVVVVGIIVLSEKMGSQRKSGKVKEFFPDFSEANCSAFQITDKNGSIKLKKQGDIWVIESQEEKETEEEEEAAPILEETVTKDLTASEEFEYPADSGSVASVMEKLAVMKMDELISKNPDKQEVFEVDSVKGTLVEVWDSKNKSIGKFRIGKSGPDWSSHFVRMISSNDVYSVSGSIKYAFFTDKKRWRDKKVLRFDPLLLKKIKLAKKDSAVIALERTVDTTGAKWNITAPEKYPADSASLAKMVKDLSILMTSNFEENLNTPDSVTGLNDPYMVVSIELENGDKKMLTIGNLKEDDNQRWVKAEDKRPIFLLYKSKFDNVDKSLEELKKKEEEKKEEKEVE